MFEIAAELGIKVREADITRHDVFVADECFLTGTAAEIVPVVKADGRSIGNGKPGPITARIIARFRRDDARNRNPDFRPEIEQSRSDAETSRKYFGLNVSKT